MEGCTNTITNTETDSNNIENVQVYGAYKTVYSAKKVKKSGSYIDVYADFTDYSGEEIRIISVPYKNSSACVGYGHTTAGNYVYALQALLNSYGYNIKVDGTFGEKTRQALEKFQDKYTSSTDSICGKETWLALYNNF